jgi:hypothetical protein
LIGNLARIGVIPSSAEINLGIGIDARYFTRLTGRNENKENK